MSTCKIYFDKTKYMYFMIKDDTFWKKLAI